MQLIEVDRELGFILKLYSLTQDKEEILNEPIRRLNPYLKVRLRLFALSNNRCAFPGCMHPVMKADGHLLAAICHIEAANPGGERFNHKQTNEERRAFENLILLCGTHHTVTNDVNFYTVEAMKEMKRNHENKSFAVNGEPFNELQERFVDVSINEDIRFPENFLQLELQGWEDRTFSEAKRLLKEIAGLPLLTRSLYAHALIYSEMGDFWLFVDPDELALRLRQPMSNLDPHFAILSRYNLVTEWLPEEAERFATRSKKRHFYLRGLDTEDYGLNFLWLTRKQFGNKPEVLLDIIENLNFTLLDG